MAGLLANIGSKLWSGTKMVGGAVKDVAKDELYGSLGNFGSALRKRVEARPPEEKKDELSDIKKDINQQNENIASTEKAVNDAKKDAQKYQTNYVFKSIDYKLDNIQLSQKYILHDVNRLMYMVNENKQNDAIETISQPQQTEGVQNVEKSSLFDKLSLGKGLLGRSGGLLGRMATGVGSMALRAAPVVGGAALGGAAGYGLGYGVNELLNPIKRYFGYTAENYPGMAKWGREHSFWNGQTQQTTQSEKVLTEQEKQKQRNNILINAGDYKIDSSRNVSIVSLGSMLFESKSSDTIRFKSPHIVFEGNRIDFIENKTANTDSTGGGGGGGGGTTSAGPQGARFDPNISAPAFGGTPETKGAYTGFTAPMDATSIATDNQNARKFTGSAEAGSAGGGASASEAMRFFMSSEGGSFTKEQAAAIVGNLQVESINFSPDVISGKIQGDKETGSPAYGIAQWRKDRRTRFTSVFGKPIEQSTFKEQLAYVAWELTSSKSPYQGVGLSLRNYNDAQSAAAFLDKKYEISSGRDRQKREQNAARLANEPIKSNVKVEKTKTVESTSDAVKDNLSPTTSTPSLTPSTMGTDIKPVPVKTESVIPNKSPSVDIPTPQEKTSGSTETQASPQSKDSPGKDAQQTKGSSGSYPSNDLVSMGNALKKEGLLVSEHPAFGGVKGKHAPHSAHYSGRAVDINAPGGIVEANNREWGAKFDALAAKLRASGYKVIWRKAGHFNHLHAQVGGGNSSLYDAPGGGHGEMGHDSTPTTQGGGGLPQQQTAPSTSPPLSPQSSITPGMSSTPSGGASSMSPASMAGNMLGGMIPGGMGGMLAPMIGSALASMSADMKVGNLGNMMGVPGAQLNNMSQNDIMNQRASIQPHVENHKLAQLSQPAKRTNIAPNYSQKSTGFIATPTDEEHYFGATGFMRPVTEHSKAYASASGHRSAGAFLT